MEAAAVCTGPVGPGSRVGVGTGRAVLADGVGGRGWVLSGSVRSGGGFVGFAAESPSRPGGVRQPFPESPDEGRSESWSASQPRLPRELSKAVSATADGGSSASTASATVLTGAFVTRGLRRMGTA
jgi:hypothetical protein